MRSVAQSPEYLPWGRQVLEMVVVYGLRGVGPGCYLMAEMGKKQYGWAYKLGFLNGRRYVHRINEINDFKYYPITFNKLIEKALLTQNSIRTPQMLGYLSASRGRTCDGQALKTAADLKALLERINLNKLCFKLVSGHGGAGFRVVDLIKDGGHVALRDMRAQRRYSIEEYFSELDLHEGGGYLLEYYFDQHPVISALNPSSVNTLRVMVYRAADKLPHCLGVYLRIGRSGAVVDNGLAGGIAAKVDLVNAKLGAATYASTRAHKFTHHPDTGVPIEGVEVPLLSDAVALALEALDVFPGMNYGVFDVAVGESEPAIIELNARADYVDFSIMNIPSKTALCKD